MLDGRTKHFGRSGKMCGDTFQKEFLEWTYRRFEIDKLCGSNLLHCPACSQEMHAIGVDGNRKQYRFRKASGVEKGFYDGVFLAKDDDVSSFVKHVHTKTNHALNMYRGEIYAYAMYLQKELSSAGTVGFFCCDVACKYWLYLQKVVQACPELEELLKMHPLLSVMHAKVHEWSCELKWGGRNHPGAGNTTREEVEQVNSFISRAAVTTKYMSKTVWTDIITLLAMGWNERKFANMDHMLAKRYVKNVKRLKEETSLLEEKQAELDINDTVLQEWVAEVQQWHEGTVCNSHLAIKRAIFDRLMLVNRLQEEERILGQEMKRHWGSLQRAAGTLEALSQQLQDQSNAVELSEGGREEWLSLPPEEKIE
ncbi:hypothetical protein J4Q44_G00069790 [Coregonus suidteri]|uniref:Uncharacterized protein n=1 Tax=Coregonus suidteri TaxID=861788 RepID=A0AAN8M879_9TELE